MTAYYNEHDPKAAAWLRELIKRGEIADGHVDERSIRDVKGDDLDGFTQCHFFAGIGGWSRALRLAGWDDARPVWTGSCPCQPFSSAGKRQGVADERHLWPEFYRLIGERGPSVVLGEQVASAAGREWLDGVRADLEAVAYAVGAADLCAAGAGAPHIRQRLWWVADAGAERRIGRASVEGSRRASAERGEAIDHIGDGGGGCNTGVVGDTVVARLQGHGRHVDDGRESGRLDARAAGSTPQASATGFWSAFDLVACRDGKARRVEPGTFPLADGIPGRVGLLRGYGNAIVPQVAAAFVTAYCEAAALESERAA